MISPFADLWSVRQMIAKLASLPGASWGLIICIDFKR